MNTDLPETRKCSGCKCSLLLEYFGLNRRGLLYKTCNGCRDRKKVTCELCGNDFHHQSGLNRHIKNVHDNIKDFECEICGNEFARNEYLNIHIETVHKGIKKFKCKCCDRPFGTNECLTRHIKDVHDKIKEYKCEICGNEFARNEYLKIHIKTVHKGIKDFVCSECGHEFGQMCQLTAHIKICTGELNMSSGEFAVMKVLDEMMVEYIHDRTHIPLTKYAGKALRFDFRIENFKVIIEYNGPHHYVPTRYMGVSQEKAEENFKDQLIKDQLKRDFCKEFGYEMLEISYKDFGRVREIVADFLIENGWCDQNFY